MPRLFVAINLPSTVREDLWEVPAELRASDYPIRWVASEHIHLTLKFLGDVADEQVQPVEGVLARAVGDAREFVLPVGGFGAFPNAGEPRVVWTGCEGVPALELLQDRIERELGEVGFPIEGRPFRPHLTLGRVRRGAARRALAGLRDDLGQLAYETDVTVRSIEVMESRLSSQGPKYSVRRAFPLAPMD